MSVKLTGLSFSRYGGPYVCAGFSSCAGFAARLKYSRRRSTKLLFSGSASSSLLLSASVLVSHGGVPSADCRERRRWRPAWPRPLLCSLNLSWLFLVRGTVRKSCVYSFLCLGSWVIPARWVFELQKPTPEFRDTSKTSKIGKNSITKTQGKDLQTTVKQSSFTGTLNFK